MGPLRQRGHFMVKMLHRKLGFDEAGMHTWVDEPQKYGKGFEATRHRGIKARQIWNKTTKASGTRVCIPRCLDAFVPCCLILIIIQ